MCGQVLANPKQANIHLSRQHSLSGKDKVAALGSMRAPCPLRKGEEAAPNERDHDMKVMPANDDAWIAWCLSCGAWEQLTKAEVARISDASEAFEDFEDYLEFDDEADSGTP